MPRFQTDTGVIVPSVTEAQMREVDRVAVEEFGLGILQMMENAGRSLALNALEMLSNNLHSAITVLAGSGGNGGGAICAARHLHNRGVGVSLVFSKGTDQLTGAAKAQLSVLEEAGVSPQAPKDARRIIEEADLVIDGLIGYSLQGAPRGESAGLIELCNRYARRILSLDIPSRVDATSGESPGVHISAERTLTLALPKPGLHNSAAGELYLADIGIPPGLYTSLGMQVEPFFGSRYYLPIISHI